MDACVCELLHLVQFHCFIFFFFKARKPVCMSSILNSIRMFARELMRCMCSILFYTYSLCWPKPFFHRFISTSSFIVRYYSLFVHNLMDMHAAGAAAAASVAWLE